MANDKPVLQTKIGLLNSMKENPQDFTFKCL